MARRRRCGAGMSTNSDRERAYPRFDRCESCNGGGMVEGYTCEECHGRGWLAAEPRPMSHEEFIAGAEAGAFD